MSLEHPPNRHARYRQYNPENSRGYDLQPMQFDRLEPVTDENESQFFIHNNMFPHINPGQVEDDAVKIKYFGCNGIYITDGETNLLIYPFFTRPRANNNRPANRERLIRAHPEIIEATLDYAGIQENGDVHAILMTHAHWDHALDIAEVWHALHPHNSEYPKIYGCPSIYQVADGGGVPESHIVYPVCGQIFRIGSFKVCFLPGAHCPMPTGAARRASIGHIRYEVPRSVFGRARVDMYRQGVISDILIEHPHGVILNKGSANFVPGLLRQLLQRYHVHADRSRSRIPFIDVLILSCSGFNTLGWGSRRFLEAITGADPYDSHRVYNHFWDNVVRPTQPYLFLLSHWERFTEGREDWLDRPPSWMYRAYQCKDIFEEELRERRRAPDVGWPTGVPPRRRQRIENFGRYITRFIPYFEEITILPIHEKDPRTGRVARRPSAFQLPEPDDPSFRSFIEEISSVRHLLR